jgi:hypothetical protein
VNFKFTDPWDSVSYFDKEVDLASQDEITGYLEGNRFTAEWEDVTVPIAGATSKGTANITLSSDLSSIATFSIEITREDGDRTYYYDVSGSNIPGIASIRRYSLDGTAACGNIIFNHYYTRENINGLWKNEMESFHCNDGTGDIAKSYIEFDLKPSE